MARQTRSGVAGISMCRTPSSASASTIALITAASAGVVPPSPPERTPSLLVGGHFAERGSQERQRVGARHRVIHQARRKQLTALRFVVAVLDQRLADPLGNSAMCLTMQDQRIDRASNIVDRSIAHDLDLTRFGVNFDLADLRTIRKARDRERL